MTHWALDNYWFVITAFLGLAVALWPRLIHDLDELQLCERVNR